MNVWTRILVSVAAFGLSFGAQAGSFDRPSMIEVGGGVAYTGGENPVEAVFKVEAVAGVDEGYTQYILAKVSGMATAGADGVSYVDFQFDTLGMHWGDVANNAGVTLLGLDLQRNVVIGNDVSLRVSFLGLRGQAEAELSDDVLFSIKGALDLLGVSYTRRATDGASLTGYGTGVSAEMGVEFFDRFRIAIGEKFGVTSGKPETYYTGYVVCDTYYDDYGYSDTYCYDETATRWRDHRMTSNTYLTLTAALTEHISIFGQANYNVYVVNDSTGEVPDSGQGAWQFFFGVSGDF